MGAGFIQEMDDDEVLRCGPIWHLASRLRLSTQKDFQEAAVGHFVPLRKKTHREECKQNGILLLILF